MNIIKSPRRRYLFIVAGHLSVIAGIVGLLLPLIPTSPFVILAAYFYARSSERFYLMLLNNKYFGKDIRRWEEHRCIDRRLKIFSVIMLILMFSGTIFIFMESAEARMLTFAFAVIPIAIVLMIRSCPD